MFLCCFGSESHPYVQAVTELTELWVERARYVFSDTPQTLHAQTNRQADRLTCARMYVIQWQIYSSVILLALTLDSVPTTIDVSSVSVSPCHTCDVCQALLSPFVGSEIGVVGKLASVLFLHRFARIEIDCAFFFLCVVFGDKEPVGVQ